MRTEKRALTNMDVYVLAREISYHRVEKLSRIPGGYRLKARPGRDLLILGPMLIPTAYSFDALPPDRFAQVFRSRFSGARVTSVEQINFDRILRIGTDRGSIILELFGRGNIILTDEEGRIIAATEQREWSARKILPGEPYVPPPPPKVRPDMDLDAFSAIFTARDVVRSLVRAGIPPAFAEEICLRAGIPKEKSTKDLADEDIESLFSAFRDVVSSLESPSPALYASGDTIVDITPIPLRVYAQMDSQTFPTLSEALDVLTPILLSEEAEEKTEKRSVVDHILRERENLQREIEELQALIGEAYKHMTEIQAALDLARSGEAPPASFGPFRLKRWSRTEIVYEFTPQP